MAYVCGMCVFRPVFVHLSFDSHHAASTAYAKFHAPECKRKYPVVAHWFKNSFYYQVAAKARHMSYNSHRLLEDSSATVSKK